MNKPTRLLLLVELAETDHDEGVFKLVGPRHNESNNGNYNVFIKTFVINITIIRIYKFVS